MRKFYVYVHTCKANGKRYVGCTTQARPELRWGRNGEGYKGQLFERAILKHGWNNFQHEVFEVDSAEEMYRKEIELISFYHSNDPKFGYNNSSGGEKGASGCKRSKEYRKKMSESRKGRTFSEEHRKHCAEANRRTANDPERIRKIAEAKKGKPRSKETKEKMSEFQKKRWLDPEYRKHMVEARKGRPLPKVKIKLPDGTIVEIAKQHLSRYYINKGKKFEYVP